MTYDWTHAPQIDKPEAGHYKTRLCKGGAFVPASIWRENGKWMGEINGELMNGDDVWQRVYSRPISQEEYRKLKRHNAYMKQNYPCSPEANPEQPFDLNGDPPTFRR